MKEVSEAKDQISACVAKETIKAIKKIAEGEGRAFSQMVAILLSESVESRKSLKNGLKPESRN